MHILPHMQPYKRTIRHFSCRLNYNGNDGISGKVTNSSSSTCDKSTRACFTQTRYEVSIEYLHDGLEFDRFVLLRRHWCFRFHRQFGKKKHVIEHNFRFFLIKPKKIFSVISLLISAQLSLIYSSGCITIVKDKMPCEQNLLCHITLTIFVVMWIA